MPICFGRLTVALLMLSLAGTSCIQQSILPDYNSSSSTDHQESDSGWSLISDAIEMREKTFVNEADESSATISVDTKIFRFSPDKIVAGLHYQTPPLRMEEWQTRLLNPDILINGSFFDENNVPTGLFIIDGEPISKQTYDPKKSGTLLIRDGFIQIVDTSLSPLPIPDEETSLLQSFPFLIKGGEPAITNDSGLMARRTVIAETKEGQFLVIIIDTTPVSLFNLMNILVESDLQITKALNLDGGPSTSIFVQTDNHSESIIPLSALPQVISFRD